MKLTKTQRKYLNLLIKIAIVALAMWFVVSKVNNQESLLEFKHLVRQLDQLTTGLVLGTVVLMMFLYWLLEIVKWRYLSRKLEQLSLWKATMSVFCGLTWALINTNRIGEFGWQVLLLRHYTRAPAAVEMRKFESEIGTAEPLESYLVGVLRVDLGHIHPQPNR